MSIRLHSCRRPPQCVAVYGFQGTHGRDPKGWLEGDNVSASPFLAVCTIGHNWLYSELWSRNWSPCQMEDPWGVGEEQPFSFYGHYLVVARVHMWRPTISHPSAHCGQATSGLPHGVEMMVWAILEGSHNDWHMDEKGVVHPGGVPNTNKGGVGSPFPVQWDNFSFTPTIHSNSLGWGRQPSDPNSGRLRLQYVEWGHGTLQGGCTLCVPEVPPT